MGGPDLLGIFTKNAVTTLVPGRGVSGGGGDKPDQPPGCAAHNYDPGGVELTLPQIPQMKNVCTAEGYQRTSLLDRHFPQGVGV